MEKVSGGSEVEGRKDGGERRRNNDVTNAFHLPCLRRLFPH